MEMEWARCLSDKMGSAGSRQCLVSSNIPSETSSHKDQSVLRHLNLSTAQHRHNHMRVRRSHYYNFCRAGGGMTVEAGVGVQEAVMEGLVALVVVLVAQWIEMAVVEAVFELEIENRWSYGEKKQTEN